MMSRDVFSQQCRRFISPRHATTAWFICQWRCMSITPDFTEFCCHRSPVGHSCPCRHRRSRAVRCGRLSVPCFYRSQSRFEVISRHMRMVWALVPTLLWLTRDCIAAGDRAVGGCVRLATRPDNTNAAVEAAQSSVVCLIRLCHVSTGGPSSTAPLLCEPLAVAPLLPPM